MREIDVRLASMKGMENTAPTDLGNAQRLRKEINALKAGIAELDRQSEKCLQNIEETGLNEVPDTLGEIRALLENVKASARKKSDLEESLAGLLRVLEGVPDNAGLEDLDKVLSSVLEHEKILERIRELGSRKAALEETLGDVRVEELERGRSLLIRWLTQREHRDLIIPAGLLTVAVLLLLGGDTRLAVLALVLFAWSLLAPVVQMKLLQGNTGRQGCRSRRSGRQGCDRFGESLGDNDGRSSVSCGNRQGYGPAAGGADDLRQRSLGIREKTGVNSALGMEMLVDRMKRPARWTS